MDARGRDDLFYRIGHDQDDELLWDAISKAENPNKADDKGLTYLHAATIGYRTGAAEVLLKKGADPNCIDSYGNTPLSYAVGKKHPNTVKMVQLLLDYGADLDLKLGEQSVREIIEMFQDEELMHFL